jgi:hypothetical protein
MLISEMFVHKMTANEMTVDKMTIGVMTIGVMTIGVMTYFPYKQLLRRTFANTSQMLCSLSGAITFSITSPSLMTLSITTSS